MPELPEVEIVRRALEPLVTGGRIQRATIHDARLTRPHSHDLVAAALTGERIDAVGRRGKYLRFDCQSGRCLVVHLRMTGSFRVAAHGSLPPDPYRRAVLILDNGSDVAYRDVRRFGTWEMFEAGEADTYFADRLGPEPFESEVTGRWLQARVEARRTSVKSVLLDQRVMAGLGNIYVDEALWRARVNPLLSASALDRAECTRIVRGVRAVLRLGLERQGATLRDYAAPSGTQGSMQDEFRVYGRDGDPCERCGAELRRALVAGRGTTFCPACQPLEGNDGYRT